MGKQLRCGGTLGCGWKTSAEVDCCGVKTSLGCNKGLMGFGSLYARIRVQTTETFIVAVTFVFASVKNEITAWNLPTPSTIILEVYLQHAYWDGISPGFIVHNQYLEY